MRALVQRTSKGRHSRQGVAALLLFVRACSWLFVCLFVGAASTADTEYTVKGSVSGHFAALASKSAATGGRDIYFKLAWTGEQMPEGADAKTQAGITYTVKYKPTPAGANNPTTPVEPPNTTNTPSTPNTPNTNNSRPRKIAKTGFNGGLVGGLGLLFLVTGVLAVRQKRS